MLQFAIKLARETGQLLLDYYHNRDTGARLKADMTVLTEADLAADRYIHAAIREQFPDDHILSEEQDTHYPGSAPAVWIIDPLDGSSNFSRGVHYWGVSIARVVDGWPQAAALYFPAIGELYAAQRGEGATLNGEQIRTAPFQGQPAAFFNCGSRTYKRYRVEIRFKPRILGSAAYNFCAVARGLSVVGFESTPRIWDIAASWLVLSEAGGVLTPIEQPPFPLQRDTSYKGVKFPTLAAADEDTLIESRGRIRPR